MSTLSRRRFNRRTLLRASAVGAVPALIAIQRSALAPERSASAVLDASIQTELFPELVTGNTNFALELFANVRQTESGNFLFSPYSVSQALAMTYAGAKGETAAQMAKTLSYRLQQPELHEAFKSLNISLTGHGNAAAIPARGEVYRSFLIANALWGEQGYPFSRSYIGQIEHFYSAGFRQSDFINAAEEARQEINDWVAGQTEDRIQDIVPENMITRDTGLVLVNTIYFSGGWASTFEPRNTEEGAFFLLDGSIVSIPFMFRIAMLPYSHGVGYQVIEFPYQVSEFSFTAILPDEGQFAAIEDGLNSETLNHMISSMTYTNVAVHLPKFTFESSALFKQSLKTLGMTDAFDQEQSDFTGMVDGVVPGPLFISDVLHKAFISVDENGTEAAAATAVIVVIGGGEAREEPREVRINRPFIFAIRDTRTGTLLFLGRVMDPST